MVHLRRGWALLALIALLLFTNPAVGAPEAHLLRIDPRASIQDSEPVLTTVIDLVQHKAMSDVTSRCANFRGDDELACLSSELDKPKALFTNFTFPEKDAYFMTTVGGRDVPAELVDITSWGEAKKKNGGAGTAWLIMIDASGQMGSRFNEARAIAKAFIDQMGPNDIIDVMFFNDREIVKHSKWTKERRLARNFVDGVPDIFRKQGRNKNLFNILKQGITDGFRSLHNVGGVEAPLHQATVILSDGNVGTDVASAAPAALQLKDYLTKGRFPEGNKTVPKIPVPVISVWLPNQAKDEVFVNARNFMENLANSEIGGAFFVVKGDENGKAKRIVQAVASRFDSMVVARWILPCLSPKVTHTFKLVFKSVEPPVSGDNHIEVPLGVDPTQWPVRINVAQTEAAAKKKPLTPGGTVTIFGDFCWGSDFDKAELYLLPKDQSAPNSLEGRGLDELAKVRKQLISQELVAKAIRGDALSVEFELPDSERFLRGKKDAFTAQLVLFDQSSNRTSALTAGEIITLPADEKPLDLLLVGGVSFGGLVLVLLVIGVARGGGDKKRRGRRGSPNTPRPVVAGSPPPPHPNTLPSGVGPSGTSQVGFGPVGPSTPSVPATQATLNSHLGQYRVGATPKKVGRDPGVSDIVLTEPRVSGMHAAVKFEYGQLMVRDEGSNNGTYINGARVQPHGWQPVPDGSVLRFGPIEFTVRFE